MEPADMEIQVLWPSRLHVSYVRSFSDQNSTILSLG
jgi:hypothetical protein